MARVLYNFVAGEKQEYQDANASQYFEQHPILLRLYDQLIALGHAPVDACNEVLSVSNVTALRIAEEMELPDVRGFSEYRLRKLGESAAKVKADTWGVRLLKIAIPGLIREITYLRMLLAEIQAEKDEGNRNI